MYAAPCSGAVAPHIERGRGAAIAPAPPGLITLAAGPEARPPLLRRGGRAQQTSVRRQSRPGAEESLDRRRKVDVDALIAAWLEIDQEREETANGWKIKILFFPAVENRPVENHGKRRLAQDRRSMWIHDDS